MQNYLRFRAVSVFFDDCSSAEGGIQLSIWPGQQPMQHCSSFEGVSLFDQAVLLLPWWTNDHCLRPGLNVVKKINACEMWIWRKIQRISWTEKKTNESVRMEIGMEEDETLQQTALRRKLGFFGHVMMLAHGDGRRRRGRPRRKWMDDIGISRACAHIVLAHTATTPNEQLRLQTDSCCCWHRILGCMPMRLITHIIFDMDESLNKRMRLICFFDGTK